MPVRDRIIKAPRTRQITNLFQGHPVNLTGLVYHHGVLFVLAAGQDDVLFSRGQKPVRLAVVNHVP